MAKAWIMAENVQSPDWNPRPSAGCWQTFEHTTGEKSTISWTGAQSEHIGEKILGHFAMVARLPTDS